MTGWLGAAYLWVKAAHLIFVIFWMAGLFLLPRFLVYHQEATPGSADAEAWIAREDSLRRMILTPSLVIVWVLGIMLAANVGLFDGQAGLGWLHAKLLLVVILSAYHGWAVSYARKLRVGRATMSSRGLRLTNEIPAVLVTLVVILVIVRPF